MLGLPDPFYHADRRISKTLRDELIRFGTREKVLDIGK